MKHFAIEIKYGLIMGLISMIWVGLEFFAARELEAFWLGNVMGMLAIFIPVTVIYLAFREIKNRMPNKLTFIRSLGSGLLIGSISGLLSAAFLLIYMYVNPDVISSYFEQVAKTMQDAGHDPHSIDEALDNLATLYNPPMQALFMFLGSSIAGTILGGAFGWIFRSKPIKPGKTT